MLRIVNILLIILFFFTSSGISCNIHYCGSSISYSIFGLNIKGNNVCCCNHDEASHEDDCCRSEIKILKSDNQKIFTTAFLKITKPFEISLLEFSGKLCVQKICGEKQYFFNIKHPPPKSISPLFIKNRILLI